MFITPYSSGSGFLFAPDSSCISTFRQSDGIPTDLEPLKCGKITLRCGAVLVHTWSISIDGNICTLYTCAFHCHLDRNRVQVSRSVAAVGLLHSRGPRGAYLASLVGRSRSDHRPHPWFEKCVRHVSNPISGGHGIRIRACTTTFESQVLDTTLVLHFTTRFLKSC